VRAQSATAAAARDEAAARGAVLSTEKEEAVSRARAALRAKEVAQAELQHLMAQRHQQVGHAPIITSLAPVHHVVDDVASVT